MKLNESDAGAIDLFVQEELESSLLQTWMWGEFQKSVGREIERIGIKRAGKLVASALLVLLRLPLGVKYVYCPRGPVVLGQGKGSPDKEILKELNSEMIEVARAWQATFIRIDPAVNPEQIKNYSGFGYRPAASETQPRITARLDLTKDREALLADMKSKVRYNIKLASRKEVTIRESIGGEDTAKFLELNKVTTERNKFFAHPDRYYKKQFDMLGRAGLLKLFIAEYKSEPIAIIVVALHGKTATYLHGTSSNKERNRMPTFLVHWEAIKVMQSMGLKWYDFHGVAPTDNKEHPWAGITRFKMGFGAERIEYMGAQDLPLKKLTYLAYSTRLKMRPSDGR